MTNESWLRLSVVAVAGVATVFGDIINAAPEAVGPPLAAVRPVTDDYFGTSIEDPYRWMEDPASAEFGQWMKRQNDYARNFLDRIQVRSELL